MYELYLQRFLEEVYWGFPPPRPTTLGAWLGLERARKCKEGLVGGGGSKEEEGGWSKQAKGVKSLDMGSYL